MTERRKFTLSTGRPRVDLIADARLMKLASPIAPSDQGGTSAPADKTPVKPAVTEPTDTTSVDATIADQIKALKDQATKIRATQEQDPDASTDPNDQKVIALLSQLDAVITQLEAAQGADVAGEPDKDPTTSEEDAPTAEPTPPSKLAAVKNTDPVLGPVDEAGNVAADATCATDGCGHLASAHEDLDSGDNSGACSMMGCMCEKFADANTSMNQPGGSDGGGANNSGGDDTAPITSSAAPLRGEFAAGEAGVPVPDAGQAPSGMDEGGVVPGDDEITELPLEPGGLNQGPAFTIPVAIIEGLPTDDNRAIAPQATEWINAPWALMGLATATHDPSGYDPNDPAVICGWIKEFQRVPGPKAGTFVLEGTGNFLTNDDGLYFADLLEQAGRMPVSADLMIMAQEVDATEVNEYGEPINALTTATKARIEAVTILPFGPAFSDCYIVLGANNKPAEIPQATEPTTAMAASAQHWMVSGECEPCDQGFDVLTASGAGPLRPPSSWFTDPKFAKGDGRLVSMIGKDKTGHMRVHEGVPLTVTDEGEVYGHIAQWGICHIGLRGECVVAPHSKTDYAFFKRGQHVITAEGEKVRVGVLTVDTNHASLAYGAGRTIDHYDHSGLQVANVAVGEDAYGIWVHGSIRPDATDEQISKLRASSQSGDWRDGELVASLTVNCPGLPQAVFAASGEQTALVAAGALGIHVLRDPQSEVVFLSDKEIFSMGRKVIAKFIRLDANASIAKLRRRNALEQIEKLEKVGH